jgi:hypothetical protein
MKKYKNCIIEPTPRAPKFLDMVKITKTTKRFAALLDKQYINQDKAILAIDTMLAELMIEKGRIKTNKELTELGIGKDIRW